MRASYHQFIFFRQFIHTQDGDDVFLLLITLWMDECHERCQCPDQQPADPADGWWSPAGQLPDRLYSYLTAQYHGCQGAQSVVAGDGSVKSSAGTYTACTEVIEPVLVEVIRSCRTPISSARVVLVTYR